MKVNLNFSPENKVGREGWAWPGREDVRPLHLQVAIRFAFSVLPSLSIQPNQQCSALPSLRRPHLIFSSERDFMEKSRLLERKIKCDLPFEREMQSINKTALSHPWRGGLWCGGGGGSHG